jgi:ABC-type sugar transport system permease subunit
MSIWKHVGFNMVIFLAGLKGIPKSYYEAATVDGAGRWERFRYITLPLLKPTSFFVIVVTLIFSFRLFTQVFVMTGGGPVNSSISIVYYFWQQGFQEFNMGYASAIAVVLFVIVFAFSIVQQRSWGGDVDY